MTDRIICYAQKRNLQVRIIRLSRRMYVEPISLSKALAHVNSDDWEIAMKGMTEIVELSRHLEFEVLEQEMSAVNRKIIQMLRSPRSQACRVACEVSGELFVTMKLTKRPVCS
ncbi:uncharacterized protein LOC113375940 [Ctenocephalides felis]|uniref:uncharacterized protein LOC113375940 n=1 Tax=Ctenocephalides felis TaxID=7515 RepID=UPI000E6E1759|nr:uncharacterized protein LOC113375940 [Ctenocephalides felis]